MYDINPKASLSLFYHKICSWIDLKLDGRHWLWKLSIVCSLISWFLAVPAYTVIADADAWVYIKLQADDMFRAYDWGHYIRRENMVMRLFLPVLASLTGKSIFVILAIQGILGVVFLYLFAKEIFRQTQDKVLTAFFAVGISNMFFCSWFFVDTVGYGDGFAYFFMLLAILYRNPFIIFVSLQCAFFTDERAVVAGGYILLSWVAYNIFEKYTNRDSLGSLVRTTLSLSSTWVLLLSWVVYFAARYYIINTYFSDHIYSTIEGPVLFKDEHRGGLGNSMWTAFEGSWLLLGAAIYVLILAKRYWLLVAFSIGFVVLLIVGLHVHDIDRALGYGFPFLLIASLILSKYLTLNEYRKLIFIMAVICVIHPMIYTLGYNRAIWAEPFPIKVMMYLDRFTGLGWFD